MKEEEEEREKTEREHAERDDADRKPQSPRKSAQDTPRRRGPNPQVFLEVEVRGKLNGKVKASGRLEFELLADSVPKTAENFRCLCTGEKGKDLHFADSAFHAIIPGFSAQGGDITAGDGTGGRSIYGDNFADEAFLRGQTERGALCMANSGRDTNNSQFHVLFDRQTSIEKKHVVFGKLLSDETDILRHMEEAGSKSGVVKSLVNITACGEVGSRASKQQGKSRSRSREMPSRVRFRDGRVDYRAMGRSSRGKERG